MPNQTPEKTLQSQLIDGEIYRIMSVDLNACIQELVPVQKGVSLTIKVANDYKAEQCWVLKKADETGSIWTFKNLLWDHYVSRDNDILKAGENPSKFHVKLVGNRTDIGLGAPQYLIYYISECGGATTFMKPQSGSSDVGKEESIGFDENENNTVVLGSKSDLGDLLNMKAGGVSQVVRWWFQPVSRQLTLKGIYRIVNKLTNSSLTLNGEPAKKGLSVVGSQIVDGEQRQYWVVNPLPDNQNLYTIKNLKFPLYITTTAASDIALVAGGNTNPTTTNAQHWAITQDTSSLSGSKSLEYYKVTSAIPLTATFAPNKIPTENSLFLDLKAGNPLDGTLVQGWVDNNGVGNQRWQFLSVPLWSIKSEH
ncbi:hypothetical protein BC936DRAFT_137328 [Jimgerdemannia flammicorona]|uniref:Uncharacterized protein n=1 Tax=Jimgerdemannia flammicorona TaxID=994334 RepID=A0A433CXM1_9FUNG|nr:hypothetical protein BC936DRAFT_137328 [Jimgerdemannia flammicorona]